MNFTTSDAARVREAASRLVEEHHLPGMAIGVVSGGDLAFSEGFGYADIESKILMTPEHRHRIASVTKTMTALCAMALVEEGKLSVDDPVAGLLPELKLKGPADALTVWHLLTHTGGIGEVPNLDDLRDPFRYLFCEELPPRTLADCYGADGLTIEVPPSTKYAYANHGFVLLGEIIQRLEQKPVAEVFRERIFGPLGMTSTALDDRAREGGSTGYHRLQGEEEKEMLRRAGREVPDEVTVDGHNVTARFLYTWGNAAQGGAQSTVPDMARYASALLRGGGGIVRPKTLASMTDDHWRPDKRLPGRGLGFGLGSFWGRPSFGHTGEFIGGWHSAMTVFPEQDTAVIVHINATFPAFEATVKGIFQAVFNQPSFAPPECRIDARILETVAGVYQATEPGPMTNFRVIINVGRVQVAVQDGGLLMHSRRGPWKHGVPLLPADPAQPDLFAIATGDPLPLFMTVLRGPDGNVTGLRFPQFVDMYPTKDVQPWA